ncbi:MAG: ATP-binding protein [Bryobacteraceae bacterium]
MLDLVAEALSATRESKHIEFKEYFDPTSAGGWCELIKDLVAIANSGGGIIVFGLNSQGEPTGAPVNLISAVDPADITNRVSKYTGCADFDVGIRDVQKCGAMLCAFLVTAVPTPLVFAKPGTYYDAGAGKEKTAFRAGTVYFRHASKSEPGTTDDLRVVISRRVDVLRKHWTKGIRKVVQAPAGSEVLMVQRPKGGGAPEGNVRLTNEPGALPVILTRDATKSGGVLLREEISDGIFDEINNVVDANCVLAKGSRRFVLGLDVYYRIYAERQHVNLGSGHGAVLLQSAITELYAPALFWLRHVPGSDIGRSYSQLFLRPRSPQVHALLRLAILLGDEFCRWLLDRWTTKWKHHPQPPNFFWTFQEMLDHSARMDFRAVAARLGPKLIQLPEEEPMSVSELLKQGEAGSALLSKTCLQVFEGDQDQRSVARGLDYLVYGQWVREQSLHLSQAIIAAIGDSEPGDPAALPSYPTS